MKLRYLECRGIRPRGDGDLDRSRSVSETFVGDRKPLVLPLVAGGEAGILGLDRRAGRRCRVELLDGVSSGGLRVRLGTDPSCCRRDADRVTGAK